LFSVYRFLASYTPQHILFFFFLLRKKEGGKETREQITKGEKSKYDRK
jgi:hypothetical protein